MSTNMTSLSKVAIFIRNGASIKQEDGAGGDPITRIETIATKEVNLNKCGYADVSADDYDNYILDTGDILISHINSTKHLGKCAIFKGKKENLIHGMNLLCLRPNKEIADPSYVYFMLSSPLFLNQLPRITKNSVNQSSFNVKSFNELEIPLPPLETQKQIAAVLEKADQLRKDCQKMEQELNNLAQSVFIDMFGEPVTNPKGWEVKPLSFIVEDFAGGKSLVAADDESTTYRNKVLKISAVTSGEFKADEAKPLPNEYAPPEVHFVKKNDLLFSRANTTELVGATAMLFDDYDSLVLPDKLWRFVWADEIAVSPVFIWRLLCDAGMRREISKLSSGSGGSMKNISKGKLKTLPIILPKLELQEKFEKVYMKLRGELADNVESRLLSEQAFNSLMQKAFKGELNLKPSNTKAA